MDKEDPAPEVVTSSIDPSNFSAMTSRNRSDSLGYAIAGCRYMLRWQKNTRIQAAATALVTVAAIWLRISALEWAMLILTVALVCLAEFINAAIEAAVNLGSPSLHPMAKVAKDVAAGAVLLTVLASILIGALILGPPILERFRELSTAG